MTTPEHPGTCATWCGKPYVEAMPLIVASKAAFWAKPSGDASVCMCSEKCCDIGRPRNPTPAEPPSFSALVEAAGPLPTTGLASAERPPELHPSVPVDEGGWPCREEAREMKRKLRAVVCAECGHRWEPPGGISGQTMPRCTVCALKRGLDAAIRERDAYKKAKAENDERFMLERDATRRELAEARREYDEAAIAHQEALKITNDELTSVRRERDALKRQVGEAIERCAREVDSLPAVGIATVPYLTALKAAAAAIRALATPPEPQR